MIVTTKRNARWVFALAEGLRPRRPEGRRVMMRAAAGIHLSHTRDDTRVAAEFVQRVGAGSAHRRSYPAP